MLCADAQACEHVGDRAGPGGGASMRTVASLEECFSLEAGRVYLTGVQALVRVVLDHQRAELRRACDTATFVSGYPGSPLGGLDRELDRQLAAFPELAITHVPGLNE